MHYRYYAIYGCTASNQACQLPIIFNFAKEVAWHSTKLKGPRENPDIYIYIYIYMYMDIYIYTDSKIIVSTWWGSLRLALIIYSMVPSGPFDVAHTIYKQYPSQQQFFHRLRTPCEFLIYGLSRQAGHYLDNAIDSRVKGLETEVFTLIITQHPLLVS